MFQMKIVQAVLYAVTMSICVILMVKKWKSNDKILWFAMALCWLGAFIGKLSEIR